MLNLPTLSPNLTSLRTNPGLSERKHTEIWSEKVQDLSRFGAWWFRWPELGAVVEELVSVTGCEARRDPLQTALSRRTLLVDVLDVDLWCVQFSSPMFICDRRNHDMWGNEFGVLAMNKDVSCVDHLKVRDLTLNIMIEWYWLVYVKTNYSYRKFI